MQFFGKFGIGASPPERVGEPSYIVDPPLSPESRGGKRKVPQLQLYSRLFPRNGIIYEVAPW